MITKKSSGCQHSFRSGKRSVEYKCDSLCHWVLQSYQLHPCIQQSDRPLTKTIQKTEEDCKKDRYPAPTLRRQHHSRIWEVIIQSN